MFRWIGRTFECWYNFACAREMAKNRQFVAGDGNRTDIADTTKHIRNCMLWVHMNSLRSHSRLLHIINIAKCVCIFHLPWNKCCAAAICLQIGWNFCSVTAVSRIILFLDSSSTAKNNKVKYKSHHTSLTFYTEILFICAIWRLQC